ncbi:MAG TPA: hypothetical protein VFA77_12615, partial [Candidatus Eisenbacteria bacterium]|nr:hypothetical protein [Candidatus Eisenbacteria bacterium]
MRQSVGRPLGKDAAEDTRGRISLDTITESFAKAHSVSELRSRMLWFSMLRRGTNFLGYKATNVSITATLVHYSLQTGQTVFIDDGVEFGPSLSFDTQSVPTRAGAATHLAQELQSHGLAILHLNSREAVCLKQEIFERLKDASLTRVLVTRQPLPDKAPRDETWLSPFGPLTTKAAKAAAAALTNRTVASSIPLRADLAPDQHMSVSLDSPSVAQVMAVYADLTGRRLLPRTNSVSERIDELLNGALSKWKLVPRLPAPDSGVRIHNDGMFTTAEVKAAIEAQLRTNGLALVPVGTKEFRVVAAEVTRLTSNGKDQSLLTSAATNVEKVWLAKHEKPLALLYTYSLIIALVCGTAGLPHILVRFYTNPDGVAAKRTTMWVMILIGVFYLFPPIFGVMGRNLLPALYAGVGAKGTDKVVLELPRILNSHSPTDSLTHSPVEKVSERVGEWVSEKQRVPWGSILSGITCAGAFAAFMSTFSGLLVSMTGALAHDVFGRMLRPKSTPAQRLRAFRVCAVLVGAVAILLGMQV